MKTLIETLKWSAVLALTILGSCQWVRSVVDAEVATNPTLASEYAQATQIRDAKLAALTEAKETGAPPSAYATQQAEFDQAQKAVEAVETRIVQEKGAPWVAMIGSIHPAAGGAAAAALNTTLAFTFSGTRRKLIKDAVKKLNPAKGKIDIIGAATDILKANTIAHKKPATLTAA